MFPLSAQGVFEFLASKGVQQQPVGLQIMVHGTVPTGELVIDWRCRSAVLCHATRSITACSCHSRDD